jgi:hypothetical protein
VVTHHQRMITPFFLTNRSVFATTYHKHSNDVNGPYTLIRSSQGNEAIVEENYHLVGDDVEADFILFWLHCTPLTETSSMVQVVVHVNFGGAFPSKFQKFIAKKQANITADLATYFKTHPD